jgi:hypothetical protein
MARKGESQRLGYADAKRMALEATTTTKLYGIPLDDAVTLDGHTAILWCGIAEDTFDDREVTNRVWHLPNNAIVRRASVDDFLHEGHQVEAFTVRGDVVAIEEIYAPVRLDGMFGAAEMLARFRGPRGRFGGFGGGFFDVPVTIEPNGSRPTQSPPGTINP